MIAIILIEGVSPNIQLASRMYITMIINITLHQNYVMLERSVGFLFENCILYDKIMGLWSIIMRDGYKCISFQHHFSFLLCNKGPGSLSILSAQGLYM